MLRIAGWLLRWFSLPLLGIMAVSLVRALGEAARAHGFGPGSLLHPAALGLLGGLAFRSGFHALLRRTGREDPFDFIDTLEHELTHALLGYLTFSPPIRLSATLKSGGEVELRGANPLSALGPYFFPLWGLALLGISLLARPGSPAFWNFLVFLFIGMFLYRLAREFAWRQGDLHLYGFAFSCLAVANLLLLMLALVLKAREILPWGWVARGAHMGWQALVYLYRITLYPVG